ncbi:tRNA (adenosine(37)-N6)-dimethylallyltransferase MiaA [Clostridium aminobutyricum]|uniref:tRNA dimethylallyltransferase n=1 Tax=Clostridium aminobutyricum TaxID=33953 RepID=A0A939D7H6_CLOAM|nr:tRNA (adenosine(37)-N6)-dimethylallyltransferase MiaA [Clostridium aminobutyricum]MBN7772515.1 tRNA (adenosine(37)-N6)-dimethylallyltransferase MiaA [Clostridium aminobutyricum]
MKKEIIIVAGPTAVGKTKYAIEIAKAMNGEIVSCDSMQLYRFMDIGSAKPTTQEQAEVKHYLVDQIDPREPFSAAEYQKRAKAAIVEIFDKGKTPIVSGGTGLYVNSLLYDMNFSAPPVGNAYREKLEKLAEEQGNEAVYNRLKEVDPKAAERIHVNNLKKMIRAIEVAENTESGIKPFEESFVKTNDYNYTLIGLSRDREELYDRINQRVDLLLEMGLIEEISSLLSMGLTEENISMKGIGYKEIIGYLKGEYDLEHAIYLVKRNTRHYAKRQMTWFRRYEDITWFNISNYPSDEDVIEEIITWLREKR